LFDISQLNTLFVSRSNPSAYFQTENDQSPLSILFRPAHFLLQIQFGFVLSAPLLNDMALLTVFTFSFVAGVQLKNKIYLPSANVFAEKLTVH
jgi:hypothetical protein